MTEDTKLRKIAKAIERWEHDLKCINHADSRNHCREVRLDKTVLEHCIFDIKEILKK